MEKINFSNNKLRGSYNMQAGQNIEIHHHHYACKVRDEQMSLVIEQNRKLLEIQALLWNAILTLTQSGQMTNKEAASIALVRFTWSLQEAIQKLNELSNKIPASNF